MIKNTTPVSENEKARDDAFDQFIRSTKELYDRPVSKSGNAFGYSDAEEYAWDLSWATSRNRMLDQLEFLAQDFEKQGQIILGSFTRQLKERLIRK